LAPIVKGGTKAFKDILKNNTYNTGNIPLREIPSMDYLNKDNGL